MRSAIESACPRTIAASFRVSLRAGSGSRALPGESPGRSAAKVTSSSGCLAMARKQDVTARLNGSVGDSLEPVLNLILDVLIAPYSIAPLRGEGRGEGVMRKTEHEAPHPTCFARHLSQAGRRSSLAQRDIHR